jgi:hypothetical protein
MKLRSVADADHESSSSRLPSNKRPPPSAIRALTETSLFLVRRLSKAFFNSQSPGDGRMGGVLWLFILFNFLI